MPRVVFSIKEEVDNTTIAHFSGDGNVGIGTKEPRHDLDVGSSNFGFQRGDVSPNAGYLRFGDNSGWKYHIARSRESVGASFNGDTTGTLVTVQDNGNVGIGTTSPMGKLDVNGSILQRGVSLHADYVFEAGYNLEPIHEHSEFMWKNKHLKAIPKAMVGENGMEIVEVGSHRKGIVEELEKAHIYISQLEDRLAKVEALLKAGH